MLLDSRHGISLLLLHFKGKQFLIQTYQPIIALGSLLAHLCQAGLHTRVFIFDLVKLNLQIMVLMSNLFNLDGWCNCVAALGCCGQDLV